MQIPYNQLSYPSQYTHHEAPREAYVLEETLPSGAIRYELHYEELSRVEGKTIYWTNASGATSSTRYLGKQLVQVVEAPEYAGMTYEDLCGY